MSACAIVQPTHPTALDDEIAALALQFQEIDIFSETLKGKHAVDDPPDSEVAYASFQAELEALQIFLMDQQLAQSMGAAVYTDGGLITDLTSRDIQSHEDRRVAIRMSNEDPEIEGPPPAVVGELRTAVQEWTSTVAEILAASSLVEFSDDVIEAGPSVSYAESQADVLEKLSNTTRCSACLSRFPVALTIDTGCNAESHRYCIDCMKHVFIRATKEEPYHPPRCCGQQIPLEAFEQHMTVEEVEAFKLAGVEFSTPDRVYCSNRQCGRFIHLERVDMGMNRATCECCSQLTCSACKNAYHGDTACPDDPALRQAQELARGEGWQSCPTCHRLVDIISGCNHITCPCGANFCYVCGSRWKTCNCPHADEARIEARAEEVVDLDAPVDMPHAERQRRVWEVQRDLLEHDDCEHPGRFRRVFGGERRRRAMRCELCSDRHWKYILQCRHCHINVCEDCRRNRI
ncbi:hypothetical protein K458DRAFT_453098 [Lentithecium fluviatile CBS 122367]|uniref:RBR-type E3 ubiquitin transferase n=1 Tax=Lentithecium fluviatile CBS 122367 TaxID=1168545 RepID=A0A6G1J036_9PLEO|nr:hypothetical protein K458DRAFT_453098 [Lentithecium fluviatile CBS 122367]